MSMQVGLIGQNMLRITKLCSSILGIVSKHVKVVTYQDNLWKILRTQLAGCMANMFVAIPRATKETSELTD